MKARVPGLIIRETQTADLNSIYRLGLDEPLFGLMQGWNASDLADLFCSKDLLAFTASRKKTVLGFIIGRITDEAAEIEWLLVKDRVRKLGIGTSLLDEFIKSAKNCGILNILIAPFPGGTETETFFKRRDISEKECFTRLSGRLKTGELP